MISFENASRLDGAGLARGSLEGKSRPAKASGPLVDMISSETESRPAGGRFSGSLLVREICLSNSAMGEVGRPVCGGSEMEGLDANILLTSRNMTVWMYYKTIIKAKLRYTITHRRVRTKCEWPNLSSGTNVRGNRNWLNRGCMPHWVGATDVAYVCGLS